MEIGTDFGTEGVAEDDRVDRLVGDPLVINI